MSRKRALLVAIAAVALLIWAVSTEDDHGYEGGYTSHGV